MPTASAIEAKARLHRKAKKLWDANSNSLVTAFRGNGGDFGAFVEALEPILLPVIRAEMSAKRREDQARATYAMSQLWASGYG